ncbi:MAG TPA: RNA polymerase subunit sigma-24, partial [Baekduia sp.]
GAAVIARFMATIPQLRRRFGDFEEQRVTVNGQPGRLLRGPGEPEFGDAERLAVEEGMARLRAGDVSPEELRALVAESRREAGLAAVPFTAPAGGEGEAGDAARPAVRDVLTVDVVDGLIQTVRIVRNPDKLAHL